MVRIILHDTQSRIESNQKKKQTKRCDELIKKKIHLKTKMSSATVDPNSIREHIYFYQRDVANHQAQRDLLRQNLKMTANTSDRERIRDEMDKITEMIDDAMRVIEKLRNELDIAIAQQMKAEFDVRNQQLHAKDQMLEETNQMVAQLGQEVAQLAAQRLSERRKSQSQSRQVLTQPSHVRFIPTIPAPLHQELPSILPTHAWNQVYDILEQILRFYEPEYILPTCWNKMQLSTSKEVCEPLLGPFYHSSETNVLPVLNGEFDLRFLNAPRLPATQIRRSLVLHHPLPPVFLLLGVSGTGKTSSLFELAQERYTLLIQCSAYPQQSTLSSATDDIDYAFATMSEQIASTIFRHRQQHQHHHHHHDNDTSLNSLASPILLADIILRWFFLEHMIRNTSESSVTPLAFLLYQLQYVRSNEFFVKARTQLTRLNMSTLWHIYKEERKNIDRMLSRVHINTHRPPPMFLLGVDEAQAASVGNMKNTIQSVSHAELMSFDDLSSEMEKEEVTTEYVPTCRGLLGPLIHILVKTNLPMVICGTALELDSMAQIRSNVGKRRQVLFPIYATKFVEQPIAQLRTWLNIDDCIESNPAIMSQYNQFLQGRPRLITRIVDLVSEIHMSGCTLSKCQQLLSAMKNTLIYHEGQLQRRLESNRHSATLKPLLFRMFIAATLRGGKCKFIPLESSKQDHEWDLMQLGFLGLTERALGSTMDGRMRSLQFPTPYHYQVWTLTEPFVMRLLRKMFSIEKNTKVMQTHLAKQMLELLDEYGRKCSGKGFILEKMVGIAWCKDVWQQRALSSLSWIENIFRTEALDMPKWLSEFVWQCDSTDVLPEGQTESQWIRTNSEVMGRCILPSKSMGPDLFMILPHPTLRNEWLFVQCGCKLFTHYLLSAKRIDQERKLSYQQHLRHVSLDQHNEWDAAWRRRLGVSPTYVPFQLCISITLPFAANDEELKRIEIDGPGRKEENRSVLIRMNINDIVHLFPRDSVVYLILQYACQLETKEVMVSDYDSF